MSFGSTKLKEVFWRERIDGIEANIFLPKPKLAIEYDGNHWHKDRVESDLEKNVFFAKRGIREIGVRHFLFHISMV